MSAIYKNYAKYPGVCFIYHNDDLYNLDKFDEDATQAFTLLAMSGLQLCNPNGTINTTFQKILDKHGYRLLMTGVSHIHSPYNTIYLYGKSGGNKKDPLPRKITKPENEFCTLSNHSYFHCCGISFYQADQPGKIFSHPLKQTWDAKNKVYEVLEQEPWELMAKPKHAITLISVRESWTTKEHREWFKKSGFTRLFREKCTDEEVKGMYRLYGRVEHTEKPER